jgi:hypothetical protein
MCVSINLVDEVDLDLHPPHVSGIVASSSSIILTHKFCRIHRIFVLALSCKTVLVLDRKNRFDHELMETYMRNASKSVDLPMARACPCQPLLWRTRNELAHKDALANQWT